MEHQLRLITLNTHSLLEADTDFCLKTLAEALLQEDTDILCLQEINQLSSSPLLAPDTAKDCGYLPCGDPHPLKEGNFALLLAQKLQSMGSTFYWTWCYTHIGYGRFDEGVAIFSRKPIKQCLFLKLSPDGADCARTLLGIETQGRRYYSVHLGWWKDPADPLREQLQRIQDFTSGFSGIQYLQGDFNSPAQVRNEGYDWMLEHGWLDCYPMSEQHDDGITVGGQIDGWRSGKVDPMRIDFCFTNTDQQVSESRVIFNNRFYPVISDHCGVMTVFPEDQEKQ